MRKSLIISAALAVIALSSCVSTKNNAYTTVPETMVVNMTVADIDVAEEPVTVTTTWNWNPFRKIKDYKKNAEGIALREAKADVLVNPSYEVKKRGFLRGGSVTVTGHPGKYVNYRNMTEKDAEVINTLAGNIGVATPIVTTSAPSLIDRIIPKKGRKLFKAPKLPKANPDWTSRSVVSVLFGGGGGDMVDCDFSLGLMYGHYNRNWGWYGKGTLDWGNDATAFTLTGGAIKTLPSNFNLFAGAGIGNCLESGPVVPFDLGVMWNFKGITLSLSFQAAMSTDDPGSYTTYKMYGGIGYTF